jgi:hypothetical protein
MQTVEGERNYDLMGLPDPTFAYFLLFSRSRQIILSF